LTNKNYEELRILYEKYNSKGLEILAFPCNNFGSQEPGSNSEIQAFARAKGATFPVLGKLECENADLTHPLYTYLKGALPAPLFGSGNFSSIFDHMLLYASKASSGTLLSFWSMGTVFQWSATSP
jgi:glutathione peroxidase-family protein